MTEEKRHGGSLEVKLLESVEIDVAGRTIKVKGEKGELSRKFSEDFIRLEKEDGKIKITARSKRFPFRKQMAIMGSIAGHIKNMMHGVSEGFSYKLKVVYSHFPMKIEVKDGVVLIDNFLGEKYPRKSLILEGCQVKVKGQDVEVTGINKENVGQTAANLELATKVKNLDVRIFQDGIYITEKAGKPVI